MDSTEGICSMLPRNLCVAEKGLTLGSIGHLLYFPMYRSQKRALSQAVLVQVPITNNRAIHRRVDLHADKIGKVLMFFVFFFALNFNQSTNTFNFTHPLPAHALGIKHISGITPHINFSLCHSRHNGLKYDLIQMCDMFL